MYLFPGVQNTTSVTQETDQNYGLFKSDVRWNIAKLKSYLVRDFTRRQSLHDLDPSSNAAPAKLVSLSREHYGLILAGREANAEKDLSYLRPAFHNAFSKRKNLSSWKKVGAVPCTREALKHRSVRKEVERDDTLILIEDFDPFKKIITAQLPCWK